MTKNIIFDFGDIFINLDKAATAKAMVPYGYLGMTSQLDDLFKAYEKGAVSSEKFLDTISTIFPSASREQLITAWNSILLDFPEERLVFLEDLAASRRYRLFLLSNTNEIHIAHEKQEMGERFSRFKNAFEGFYLSYEMGLRKPDREIFECVLQANHIKAEETLFIDDTLENIETAIDMGIKTWHLSVGKEDITQLNSHL